MDTTAAEKFLHRARDLVRCWCLSIVLGAEPGVRRARAAGRQEKDAFVFRTGLAAHWVTSLAPLSLGKGTAEQSLFIVECAMQRRKEILSPHTVFEPLPE